MAYEQALSNVRRVGLSLFKRSNSYRFTFFFRIYLRFIFKTNVRLHFEFRLDSIKYTCIYILHYSKQYTSDRSRKFPFNYTHSILIRRFASSFMLNRILHRIQKIRFRMVIDVEHSDKTKPVYVRYNPLNSLNRILKTSLEIVNNIVWYYVR